MSVADVLTAGGIARSADVVAICASTGLEVAAAAAMLDMESGGGRNVWGHDGVPTGGFYVKGDVVTQSAYSLYKAHRSALGAQGCGPCQLTDPGLQNEADAIGGCWDWIANATVGFRHLAGLIGRSGAHDGFREYNGGGLVNAADTAYAAGAMALLTTWRTRLAAVKENSMEWADKAIPDYAGGKTPPEMLGADVTIGWLAKHAGEADAKLDAVLAQLTAIAKKVGA